LTSVIGHDSFNPLISMYMLLSLSWRNTYSLSALFLFLT